MTEVNKSTSPLVVGSYDEVSTLIHGNIEHITVGPAKDVEGEDPQLEINSLVVFYHFDEEEGKLETVQYQVAARSDDNEETNQGQTSVLFGGKLTELDHIDCEEVIVREDESVEYSVNLEEFSVGVTNVSLDKAFRVLGVQIGTKILKDDVSVFAVPKQEGAARGELIVYATIRVTKEQLDELAAAVDFDEAKIARVGLMGISIGELITSFNLEKAVNDCAEQLMQQHGLDVVSTSITRFLTINLINQVVGQVTYPALRRAIISTAADAAAAAEVPETV